MGARRMSGSLPPVSRVAGPPIGARRLLVLAAAFLALALIKPWGFPAASPSATVGTHADGAAASASGGPPEAIAPWPTELPEPSPGADGIACSPAGWEIVSLDRLGGWTVRTWTPAVPVAASGPLDTAIPIVSLDSPSTLSVGVCGPATTTGTAAGSSMLVTAAWRIAGARAIPLRVATREAAALDGRLARLYRPTEAGDGGAWPAGRFVLELSPLDVPGVVPPVPGPSTGTATHWFVGVTVRAIGSAG
jgi:hypothetical protein